MSAPKVAPIPAQGIDPRGPRFGAAITSALLLCAVGLSLSTGASTEPQALSALDPLSRLTEPAGLLALGLFLLFLWGSIAGIRRHPFGLIFARIVRPRLSPPSELEPAAPPTFAQGVGGAVVGVGLALHALAVPFALPVALSAAFLAAFLNAAFAFCLGCELYLILRRFRPSRHEAPAHTAPRGRN